MGRFKLRAKRPKAEGPGPGGEPYAWFMSCDAALNAMLGSSLSTPAIIAA
jgi:hypothetical protein